MPAALTSGVRRLRFRWYHFFIPAMMLLLPLGCWQLAQQPPAVQFVGGQWLEDPGEYAGAESCRECHPEITETQLASNHAHTLRDLSKEPPVAPFDNGQEVLDKLTGARYSMKKSGKEHEIRITSGGLSAGQKLDFEFGSGAIATGYLAQVDDEQWIDARLNYYRPIQGWDFTSSQEKANAYLKEQPLGRPQTAAEAARCFACHTTVLRAHGVGKEPSDGAKIRVAPEKSVLGVTCESCHGPRAQHVRDHRSGKATAVSGKMSADRMNEVCGKCHGLQGVNPDHPVISRFQPWGLSLSKCFRASEGKLSCATCHDPHTNLKRDIPFYEKKCVSCHTGTAESVGKTVCPVNRKSGCVGCHMPTDTKSMLHASFVDHRIRILTGTEKGKPAAAGH